MCCALYSYGSQGFICKEIIFPHWLNLLVIAKSLCRRQSINMHMHFIHIWFLRFHLQGNYFPHWLHLPEISKSACRKQSINMHVHFHMVHKVSFARKLFFTLVAIASNCQISVLKILLTYMFIVHFVHMVPQGIVSYRNGSVS